jgi:hypothetical protein
MPRGLLALVCCAASAFGQNALAAESQADAPKAVEARKPVIKKSIKENEPMQGHMKSDGMMKGDMKAAAAKKDAEMNWTIKQEEKTMPGDPKK